MHLLRNLWWLSLVVLSRSNLIVHAWTIFILLLVVCAAYFMLWYSSLYHDCYTDNQTAYLTFSGFVCQRPQRLPVRMPCSHHAWRPPAGAPFRRCLRWHHHFRPPFQSPFIRVKNSIKVSASFVSYLYSWTAGCALWWTVLHKDLVVGYSALNVNLRLHKFK